jgi:poly(3-hydroxybutyrate) depolymerase
MTPVDLQIRTLDVDGIERTFWLCESRLRAPAPLIVALHGHGMTGPKLARASALADAASAAGFNIVFPDALERIWDDHGMGRRDRADDDKFFATLIDYLRRRGEIGDADPFLVGVENGACFAERLSREGVHALSGAALIAGTAREASRRLTPRPRRSLPLLIAVGARGGRDRVGLRNRLALRSTKHHGQIDARTLLGDWQPINEAAGAPIVQRPLAGATRLWPRGASGRALVSEVVEFARSAVG